MSLRGLVHMKYENWLLFVALAPRSKLALVCGPPLSLQRQYQRTLV